MAELTVREQLAVYEDGTPDPRAERQQNHHPAASAARSVMHLRQSGGVGIVDDRDLALQCPAETSGCMIANPGLVDVGSGMNYPLADDRRDGNSDSSFPRELVDHRRDQLGNRLRCGRLRGRISNPIGYQSARFQVDDSALDSGSAHVEAEDLPRERGPGHVSINGGDFRLTASHSPRISTSSCGLGSPSAREYR